MIPDHVKIFNEAEYFIPSNMRLILPIIPLENNKQTAKETLFEASSNTTFKFSYGVTHLLCYEADNDNRQARRHASKWQKETNRNKLRGTMSYNSAI